MISETEFEFLLKQVIAKTKGQIRTALPGLVDSFDPVTQTATVRTSIATWRIDPDTDEPVAYFPEATTNAPVLYPGGGGWSLRFPIEAGDRCTLLVAERSIDEWMATGGRVAPQDLGRRFDLTDAIVIPGLRPAADPLADFDADSLEIVHENGTVLRLNPDGTVYLGNSTVDLVATSRAVQDLLQNVINLLQAFATTASGDPVATVTAGAAATLNTALSSLAGTITAINGQFASLEE